MSDKRIDTLGELNGVLGRLQSLRKQLVEDARDELAEKPGQAELINQYIGEAEDVIMAALKPAPNAPRDDGGMMPMVGLGSQVASTLAQSASAPLVPNYDDQISRDRLYAIGDLYYLYQMEALGTFRAVLKLQQMFKSGEVRLSDGAGAMALFQYDRKRVLRYTLSDRRAAYRKVFGYTDTSPPTGAEPNAPFHPLMVNFTKHVSNFFQDKRVSEVVRPDTTRESFGSMAVVRRAGLDLRQNLKHASYGHIAVLRSEMMVLLRDAFEILDAEDIKQTLRGGYALRRSRGLAAARVGRASADVAAASDGCDGKRCASLVGGGLHSVRGADRLRGPSRGYRRRGGRLVDERGIARAAQAGVRGSGRSHHRLPTEAAYAKRIGALECHRGGGADDVAATAGGSGRDRRLDAGVDDLPA